VTLTDLSSFKNATVWAKFDFRAENIHTLMYIYPNLIRPAHNNITVPSLVLPVPGKRRLHEKRRLQMGIGIQIGIRNNTFSKGSFEKRHEL